MKRKKLQILPKALDDLEEIYRYSNKEFGKKKARQYISDLDKAFVKLSEHSSLGCDYSDVRPNIKALPIISHMVFYKSSDVAVIIVRVLHKSMDYKRHFN